MLCPDGSHLVWLDAEVSPAGTATLHCHVNDDRLRPHFISNCTSGELVRVTRTAAGEIGLGADAAGHHSIKRPIQRPGGFHEHDGTLPCHRSNL